MMTRIFLIIASLICGSALAKGLNSSPNSGLYPSGQGGIPVVVPAPAPALAAGYTLNTFSTQSNFNASGIVDMAATNVAGFKWYLWKFFGSTQTATPVTLNSDGTVTISNGAGYNGTLASTVPIGTSPYFHGTAFGGGGYFEAELGFDAANVVFAAGWPAWWTMSNEHLIGDYGDAWTGQATGYTHFIEPDIFEYDIKANSGIYGSATHEYWGVYNVTCTNFCSQYELVTATPGRRPSVFSMFFPPVVNFSLYHKYGMLWIPATGTTSGSLTFYFDGISMGSFSYTHFTTQSPPPTGQPWAYGIIDNNHLTLILGNDSAARMQIRSVNIWQATTANNVTN
jgi:hypothetical protein